MPRFMITAIRYWKDPNLSLEFKRCNLSELKIRVYRQLYWTIKELLVCNITPKTRNNCEKGL